MSAKSSVASRRVRSGKVPLAVSICVGQGGEDIGLLFSPYRRTSKYEQALIDKNREKAIYSDFGLERLLECREILDGLIDAKLRRPVKVA